MSLLKSLLFLSLLLTCFQQAEAFCGFERVLPNRFEIGPEIYHIKRLKEGGSEQSGWLYGGRIRIEHSSACGIYWGFDSFRASGKTSGNTASGKKIRSKFRDGELEGRIGYMFQFNLCKQIQLTPFVGYGSFYGRNFFIHPSPMRCHFHNRFMFVSTGFLSSVHLTDRIDIGVNFKAKFTQNGKSKITKDPDFDDITLGMQDEWQYEVNLPIRFTTCCNDRMVEGTLAPFYRFRHYGGMPNHPFDFYDTCFHLYGARFLLRLCF